MAVTVAFETGEVYTRNDAQFAAAEVVPSIEISPRLVGEVKAMETKVPSLDNWA